jgi:hypothetical protein
MVEMLPREQMVIETKGAQVIDRPLPAPVVVQTPDELYDLTLEEFDTAIPSDEMMKEFDTPHRFWEPFEPGCEIKYLPRYPSFSSTSSGIWVTRNLYEEHLVMNRLSRYGNPENFRVDEKEVRDANKTDAWLQCQQCQFRTTSVLMNRAHNRAWKHSTG